MRITKKLIAKTCLPVYYEVMEKGKDMDKNEFYSLLDDNYCDFGICRVFYSKKRIPIEMHYVLIGVLVDDGYGDLGSYYIYKVPRGADTKSEMLECIQVRIDLLESWLKQK